MPHNKPLHTEPLAARFGEFGVVRRGPVNSAVTPFERIPSFFRNLDFAHNLLQLNRSSVVLDFQGGGLCRKHPRLTLKKARISLLIRCRHPLPGMM
jgi:hypothetical protein